MLNQWSPFCHLSILNQLSIYHFINLQFLNEHSLLKNKLILDINNIIKFIINIQVYILYKLGLKLISIIQFKHLIKFYLI